MIRKTYRKFSLFFLSHPSLNLLLVVAAIFFAKLLFNYLNHHPLFSDFQLSICVALTYLTGYLAFKVKSKKFLLYIIHFIIVFSYFSIDSYFDRSLVNYTSFIILAGLALLYTGVAALAENSFNVNYGSKNK